MTSKECFEMEDVLQAFDIIKEKGVNVGYFISRLKSKTINYKDYVREQKELYLDNYVSTEVMTLKEYRLLEEILIEKEQQSEGECGC